MPVIIKSPHRDELEELTKRAIGDVLRARMATKKFFRPTIIARKSGISRTHLTDVLHGKKLVSLGIFLRLAEALRADPVELTREVLNRRTELLPPHLRSTAPVRGAMRSDCAREKTK